MGPAKLWERIGAGVAQTLVVLALLFQVVLPQGLMVSNEGGRAVIVICTGHGEVQIQAPDGPHDKKAPAKNTNQGPCAFAGHAPPVPVPVFTPLAAPKPAFAPVATPRLVTLTPGRGLAAPPPPSQGPPSSLI